MASISIRRAIPILIIVPLLTTVGLIGWLAFWSGQKTASDLINQLTQAIGGRIEKQVIAYLERPSVINQTLVLTHESELINTNDFSNLEQYFWRETQLFKEQIVVFYGDQQGNYIGIERKEDGSTVAKVRDATTAPRRNFYQLDDRGKRGDLIQTESYDPRQRSWYREAVQAGKPTWARVYTSTSGKLLASAVAPVYENGELKGVLGYDIALSQVSQFLQEIKIGDTGKAFIIEQSGEMVASSGGEPPVVTVDGKQQRLHALKIQEAIIQRTTQNLLERFGDLRSITKPESVVFNQGQREFVFVDRIEHERGLDWLMVVVIPEADFMNHIHEQTRWSLLTGLAVTALSILLGLIAARWIIQPIEHLTQAAKDIEDENFDLANLKPIINRSDEIGELARVFEDMANVVYSRQRQLQAQVKQMRSESNHTKKTALAVNLTERPYIEQLLQRSRKARGETDT